MRVPKFQPLVEKYKRFSFLFLNNMIESKIKFLTGQNK